MTSIGIREELATGSDEFEIRSEKASEPFDQRNICVKIKITFDLKLDTLLQRTLTPVFVFCFSVE